MGVEVELLTGAGGVFDVTRDGELVYSRHRTGSFPEAAEIIDALSA